MLGLIACLLTEAIVNPVYPNYKGSRELLYYNYNGGNRKCIYRGLFDRWPSGRPRSRCEDNIKMDVMVGAGLILMIALRVFRVWKYIFKN
jgi:hypothetical protein